MLTLHITQGGETHSFELPLPIETLTAELQNLGISKPLHQLTQSDFTLQAMNPLGAHFMKLLQPQDTLQAIAIYAREFDVLSSESRQALADWVMADQLRSLDHMADYLRYGSVALTHFIRLTLDGKHIDLPTPTQELQDFLGCSPRKILLSDVDCTSLNTQGKELLMQLRPSDNLVVANLAGTLLELPDIKTTMDEVVGSARNLLPELTQTQVYYCPLVASFYEDDHENPIQLHPHLLACHEDEIRTALQNEMPEDENMADYLPTNALKAKTISVDWDIEQFGDELFGKISCEMRTPLTQDEQAELVEWIAGQNSDGFGEGFEQKPIRVEELEFHVHFWYRGDCYFLLPEEDFLQQLHEQTVSQTQHFGGMGGMA